MDIDAAGAAGSHAGHKCRGKGHFAKECPSRAYSGHAVTVEEIEESDEEEWKGAKERELGKGKA
jgi:hypothetical protein